jgi:hypothetical protein
MEILNPPLGTIDCPASLILDVSWKSYQGRGELEIECLVAKKSRLLFQN